MNPDKYLRLRYIYILSIIYCIYLTYIIKVEATFDTPTYFDAWSTLLAGHVDKWRTPVYPVFLGLMNTFFGDKCLYYVVIVQHLMFLASIRYFYLIMHYSITNKTISFFLTLFYAMYPCVATYNCCIMTETFVVTGLVFLLYSILVLYKTNISRYGLYTFFWLFFLIFLRPAVVYLLPVSIVAWCIVAIKRKSFFNTSVMYGMAGSIIISIFLIVYMAMFKSCYGVFTPSGIGLINKYGIAKAANVIDFDAMENGETFYYLVAENCINTIGMEAFSDSLDQSINRNKGRYIMRLFQNLRNASEDYLFEPSNLIEIPGVVSNIMGPPIKLLYFLFFVYAFLLLRWMIRRKELAFFSCMLFMIGVSNFIVIVLASPGEYFRLLFPAVPVYIIMFGQLFDLIRIKKISEVKFE